MNKTKFYIILFNAILKFAIDKGQPNIYNT